MQCDVPTDIVNCYYGDINDDTIITEPIDGINYQTCEETGSYVGVVGESILYFPCGGYTLDFYAN